MKYFKLVLTRLIMLMCIVLPWSAPVFFAGDLYVKGVLSLYAVFLNAVVLFLIIRDVRR